jgi:hypothetical protein
VVWRIINGIKCVAVCIMTPYYIPQVFSCFAKWEGVCDMFSLTNKCAHPVCDGILRRTGLSLAIHCKSGQCCCGMTPCAIWPHASPYCQPRRPWWRGCSAQLRTLQPKLLRTFFGCFPPSFPQVSVCRRSLGWNALSPDKIALFHLCPCPVMELLFICTTILSYMCC